MNPGVQRRSSRSRLGDLIIERGWADANQIELALEEQSQSGERMARCLVRLGVLSEDQRLDALAQQLGLATVALEPLEIPSEAVDLLPREFVQQHRIVPVAVKNGTIRVATADPAQHHVLEDVRLLASREVEELLASEQEICEKIAECYQITVERMIRDLEVRDGAVEEPDNLHDIEVMASEPTVVNLVNLIFSAAIRERASDIHLVPFERELELRYRIDGLLQVMPPPPKHLHAALVSRIKIMAEMNIAERFLPQDGHIQITNNTKRVDIRVGTMPTIHGESVVMRLLEKDNRLLTLKELGLDPKREQLLSKVLEKPHGIMLATGPTGSGKTTSLYAILQSLYTTEKKILTVEDPVEYELPGVGQIPVKPTRGFTFATGLRAILRQDPDIVMVGEIRDGETAEIAIRAALTGHLVFSTLHTNDSAGAVTRLIDMGIEPFLIASSLEGVLAQRLVRRICRHCREEFQVADELLRKAEGMQIELPSEKAYRGAGCDRCRRSGYRGRLALYELLVLTRELRELILQRASSGAIEDAARSSMLTMHEDGINKVAAGTTTLEEVLRVATTQ